MKTRVDEKLDVYLQFTVSIQRMKDAEYKRGVERGVERGVDAVERIMAWLNAVDSEGTPTQRDDLIKWTKAELEKLKRLP